MVDGRRGGGSRLRRDRGGAAGAPRPVRPGGEPAAGRDAAASAAQPFSEGFRAAAADFSMRLLREQAGGMENRLLSPVSLYLTLSMLAEGHPGADPGGAGRPAGRAGGTGGHVRLAAG